MLQNICLTRLGSVKCPQKALNIQSDTEQSWSEKSVPVGFSLFFNVSMITCVLPQRGKLKSESLVEALWLQDDDKTSIPLGMSGFKKKKKKWVRLTLVSNWKMIYLTEHLTYFSSCVWCWDGTISITRWPDEKRERVCTVLHSSLCCIDGLTYTV